MGSGSLTTPAFVASENRLEFLDFEFQKPDCRTSKIKRIIIEISNSVGETELEKEI